MHEKIYVLRVCNPHGSCGTWNEYLHYTRDALSIWRFEVNDTNHKLSQFSYDIAKARYTCARRHFFILNERSEETKGVI